MRLLVTGGCGFIGSNFILRLLRLTRGAQRRQPRQADLRRQPGQPRDVADDGATASSRATSATPAPSDELVAGADTSSTSPPRATSTAPSSNRPRSSTPTWSAPRAAGGRPRQLQRRAASCTSRPTRSTARPGRPRPRDRPHPPAQPVRGQQGRRRACRCAPTTRRMGCHVVITRGGQHLSARGSTPRSSIPLFITNALDDLPLPVYGDGMQRRDWLFVEDHARRLRRPCTTGTAGRPTTSVATAWSGPTARSPRPSWRHSASPGRWCAVCPIGLGMTGATHSMAHACVASVGVLGCSSLKVSGSRPTGMRPIDPGGSRSRAASTAATTSSSTGAADSPRDHSRGAHHNPPPPTPKPPTHTPTPKALELRRWCRRRDVAEPRMRESSFVLRGAPRRRPPPPRSPAGAGLVPPAASPAGRRPSMLSRT